MITRCQHLGIPGLKIETRGTHDSCAAWCTKSPDRKEA